MKLSPVTVLMKKTGVEEQFFVPPSLAHPSGWTFVHYCPKCYEIWCVTKFPLLRDSSQEVALRTPCVECGGGDLFHYGATKDWTDYMPNSLLWHQLNAIYQEVFDNVTG